MPFIPYAAVEESTDPAVTTPPVAGYIAHHDASDPSASSMTRTGQSLTSWRDKSGNGNHLAPAGNVFIPAAPIGMERDAVPFQAGGLSYLNSNTTRSDLTSSTFLVACVTDLSSAKIFVGSQGGTGGNLFYANTSGQLVTDASGVVNLATSAFASPATVGAPFVAAQVVSASDCVQWLNLQNETDAHAQTFTGSRTTSVGATFGNVSMTGWIGELIFYDTTLSAGNALSVVQYLMAKWGIA